MRRPRVDGVDRRPSSRLRSSDAERRADSAPLTRCRRHAQHRRLGPAHTTTTGLDDVDFWVGGLAEKQAPFGGLLGSTFNCVFETQMENLQDGDRFYYLRRTAGLNLLTQLEGNSFAELIMRNTGAEGLPADVFSRPDFTFDVPNLGLTGPILDDPLTPEWDENLAARSATTRRGHDPLHRRRARRLDRLATAPTERPHPLQRG